MSDEPVRIGLVGAGAIAHTWAEASRAAENVAVTAVADTRSDLADALAEPLGVTAFASAEELAASGLCDLAVICTPPAFHVDVGLALIEQGVHVVCEKPLAVDCNGARKLVAAAADAGVVMTMASKFRFVEDVVRARSIITSGMLGAVVLFSNTFVSRSDMRNRWNSDPAVSGGGVVIDNGTHSVDIARYVFGPIADVLAVEARRVLGTTVEDTARVLLRMADGSVGTIQLSWAVGNAANTYLEVVGTDGVLRVGWSRSRFRQTSSPQWVEFGQGYDKVAAHARQLENVVDVINGRSELLITPADALASVAAVDAAYRSISEGRWVTVREDCPG